MHLIDTIGIIEKVKEGKISFEDAVSRLSTFNNPVHSSVSLALLDKEINGAKETISSLVSLDRETLVKPDFIKEGAWKIILVKFSDWEIQQLFKNQEEYAYAWELIEEKARERLSQITEKKTT
jgi:hypothetical protein